MWLVRMVTQDSASLHCKWGIRKLACQGTLAATWHFGFAPTGTVSLHFMGNLPPGSATGLGGQMENFLPGTGLGTRGQRILLGSHLPVQSFPFRFNLVSSLSIAFPKYSNPYWSFPTLNFSHATFCRRRERGVHLFIFAVLLIYAM